MKRKKYSKQKLVGMRVRILQEEELTLTIKRDEVVRIPPEVFTDGNEQTYFAIFSERRGGLEAAMKRAQLLHESLPREIEMGIAVALKTETYEDIIRLGATLGIINS